MTLPGAKDALAFLRAFLRRPDAIGSIVPSSPALARLVATAADLAPARAVVELGAGTGPITAARRSAAPDAPQMCVEPDAALSDALGARFPGLRIHRAPAGADLPEVVAAWGHPTVARVVSGLPWTLWPEAVQAPILDGVAAALDDDGRFLTYTYLTSQISPGLAVFLRLLRARFHEVRRLPVLWANMPPAVVYVADRPRRAAVAPDLRA